MVNASAFDPATLERFSRQETPLHRLDPRALLVTTLLFAVTVISHGKYAVSALTPFLLYPAVLMGLGNIPVGYVARKVLLVSPFAVMVGVFNPWLDPAPLLQLGGVPVAAGWLSFTSLLLRFVLTVSALISLIAIIGMNAFCRALEGLGAPRVLVVQLLFLYRYLFLLGEEAARLARARSLRAFGGHGMGPGVYAQLAGQLLVRTLDRAKRIHIAMLSRGFDGQVRLWRTLSMTRRDWLFLLGWCTLFALLRLTGAVNGLGRLVVG